MVRRGRRVVALGLWGAALAVSCADPSHGPADSTEARIARHLAADGAGGADGRAGSRAIARALERLYAERDGAPIWSRGPLVRSAARTLLERVLAAEDEGLDPDDYGASDLAARWDELARPELDDDARAELLTGLDVALTRAYLVFAAHQRGGRVDPERLAPRTVDDVALDDATRALDDAARRGSLPRALDRLTPDRTDYRALAAELAALREGRPASDGAPLDDAARAARLRALMVNLERRRWPPAELGPRWVRVNVAAATLEAEVDGRPHLAMKVVVGRRYRETPLFTSALTEVVLSPAWYVPDRIAARDLLPQIRKDPAYLAAKGFHVYAATSTRAAELDPSRIDWASLDPGRPLPVRLRQDPGPENALGRIQLVLPNPYEVSLHDTPSPKLFERSRRSFSSGCIRLERPRALVELLLEGTPGWSPERLDRALATAETRTIVLHHPTPVHLVYWTAWADPGGTVRYAEDGYGRDAPLARALGLR